MKLYDILGKYYVSGEFKMPTVSASEAAAPEGDDSYVAYKISGDELPNDIKADLLRDAVNDCEYYTGNCSLPSEILGEPIYYLIARLDKRGEIQSVHLGCELTVKDKIVKPSAEAQTWLNWMAFERKILGDHYNNISQIAGACTALDVIFSSEVEYKTMCNIVAMSA